MGKTATFVALLLTSAASHAYAAPSFKILYHEGIRPQVKQVAGFTRSMSFGAYGRQFNLQLQANPALMNAVPAGVAGTIVEVCAANAEAVEYGETLFRVEPDA